MPCMHALILSLRDLRKVLPGDNNRESGGQLQSRPLPTIVRKGRNGEKSHSLGGFHGSVCVRHFTHDILTNSTATLACYCYCPVFLSWGNGGSKVILNWPEITQLASRAEILTGASLTLGPPSSTAQRVPTLWWLIADSVYLFFRLRPGYPLNTIFF